MSAGPGADVRAALLAPLLPAGCRVSAGPDDETAEPLYPAEEAVVASALARRQREFALGRMHARRVLRALGHEPVPIGVRFDRAPQWPRGVVGTITHTQGLVAAAAAWGDELAGIGLDVESRARPLRERLARFILTARERDNLNALPDHLDPLRLAFSAKEAVHKCIAPMSGITLGFHDVELEFGRTAGCFSVRLVAACNSRLPDFGRLAGRFAVTNEYVAATVFAPRQTKKTEPSRQDGVVPVPRHHMILDAR